MNCCQLNTNCNCFLEKNCDITCACVQQAKHLDFFARLKKNSFLVLKQLLQKNKPLIAMESEFYSDSYNSEWRTCYILVIPTTYVGLERIKNKRIEKFVRRNLVQQCSTYFRALILRKKGKAFQQYYPNYLKDAEGNNLKNPSGSLAFTNHPLPRLTQYYIIGNEGDLRIGWQTPNDFRRYDHGNEGFRANVMDLMNEDDMELFDKGF
jgi:hypothetical protein